MDTTDENRLTQSRELTGGPTYKTKTKLKLVFDFL